MSEFVEQTIKFVKIKENVKILLSLNSFSETKDYDFIKKMKDQNMVRIFLVKYNFINLIKIENESIIEDLFSIYQQSTIQSWEKLYFNSIDFKSKDLDLLEKFSEKTNLKKIDSTIFSIFSDIDSSFFENLIDFYNTFKPSLLVYFRAINELKMIVLPNIKTGEIYFSFYIHVSLFDF